MDFDEYRREGKHMVDYIADYLQNIRSRRVFPDVSPGYMRHLVPDTAPEAGEPWSTIFQDIERVVMPGVTHWQSPHMHAYFPALNSFQSLLGDMLADAIGCLGFTWASSPACTELEIIVMDWLAKMIGLPFEFFHSNKETMGGGVIQTTASEATFVALLAARSEAIKRCRMLQPDLEDAEINARLVGYCSDQAHSSVEKAGLIGLVTMRLLTSDEQLTLRGKTLREAIEKDKQLGLIPFYLCATLGTTGACAFDNLSELGPICEAEGMWMHIDAAYAGTAFICPEFRVFMSGVEYANSFAFNPSKWMMVHFDCTAMWVKDSRALHRTFNVQPLYLRHENTGTAIDYMHWQVPLSKRFRALKLWFVIRSFGVRGLQQHVREGVRLATMFEQLVETDKRFEVAAKRHLGMVVFRLRGDNVLTELLLRTLNSSGAVHMVPASLQGRYVIRFTVTSHYTRDNDIERDWTIIRESAGDILSSLSPEPATDVNGFKASKAEDQDVEEGVRAADAEDDTCDPKKPPVSSSEAAEMAIQQKRNRLRRRGGEFGLSLMLSNVPMSPKFINGSFAALFDSVELVSEYARHISRSDVDLNGSPMRMSPRRRPYLGVTKSRQYSLDHGFSLLNHKQHHHQHQFGVADARAATRPGAADGGAETALGGEKQRSANGYLATGRQGSLDSKIEEIFQTPVNQVHELHISREELHVADEFEVDGNQPDGVTSKETTTDDHPQVLSEAKGEGGVAVGGIIQHTYVNEKINGIRSSTTCKQCGHVINIQGEDR